VPKPDVARGFVKLTWGMRTETEKAEGAPHRLGGEQSARRSPWTTGRFALSDYFDKPTGRSRRRIISTS